MSSSTVPPMTSAPSARFLPRLCVGMAEGPLLRVADGRQLSHALLVERLRRALIDAGLPAASFGGHSLRIGAATTAAARGVGDDRIRALGRRRSNFYMRYIRLAADARAPLSATLSK